MTIADLINRIITGILNPALTLLFGIAFIMFIYGVVVYVIGSHGDQTKLKQGKMAIIWGIVGMAIMFSAWGLVRIVCDFFRTCAPFGFSFF